MIIYLDKIYSDLEWWRTENKITAESQKGSYLVNVMEELGELADGLRNFEKYRNKLKNADLVLDAVFDFQLEREKAEFSIIDAICDIAVFTINAGADILPRKKEDKIDTSEIERHNLFNVSNLIIDCGNYDRSRCTNHLYFNYILKDCTNLCKQFGYSFELAMLEKIRAISSGSGVYNEKADYEKARIEK